MLKSHLFSQPWGDTLYYCLVPHFVNWHVFLNSAHTITLGLETTAIDARWVRTPKRPYNYLETAVKSINCLRKTFKTLIIACRQLFLNTEQLFDLDYCHSGSHFILSIWEPFWFFTFVVLHSISKGFWGYECFYFSFSDVPVPSLMGITFTTRSQNDILYSAIANQVCVFPYITM